MAKNMVLTYLHLLDPEITIEVTMAMKKLVIIGIIYSFP